MSKSQALTPDEFARRMKEIFKSPDKETAHGKADDLMCDLLKILGYGKGIKIYEQEERWYA